MRGTTTRWVALTVLAGAALSACGSDDSGDGDGADDPVVVEITFEDGEVTPNGERVEVDAGQPVDLEVTADAPGSIHLHSDPEQEFEYDAGTETFEIQIDRPGIVEVESHELEVIIVQLEVK
ncbi:hypothetical protein [Nocardioides pelophilus]|uniref:hypothetical protein n=1 Tax=Nocardioides pelophilus TaxID=2172019 RepID=UPI0016045CF4|nr:hypothetical protein [Nocardioides pelophilus]